MPAKKKRSKKNSYFTLDHQEAIVRYASTKCQKERTDLYIKWIQPAFDEMVDKIVYTYKFNNLPNIDPLKDECKVWLTTILDKYDPSKGSKAFSYFSVVTKNWFIHRVKKNSKKVRREISFEDLVENGGTGILGTADETPSYIDQRAEVEFWNSLLLQLDRWDTKQLKKNEKNVLHAIRVLLNNVDNIEIFNKKAVYLYLRELTGLNTKQVVNNLNKIRERYRTFKVRWDRD